MKRRFQTIFWMACLPFLLVPKLYSQIKNYHVFYQSQPDLHVRELYYSNGKWWGNDLTAATNGPPAYSGLTSFFDGRNEHVFYVSGDRHVHELYYINGPDFSSVPWDNVTAYTNGPQATSGPNSLFFVSVPVIE